MVCHEKVVRIPLEGDEIRRVHDERTQGVVKTLMNIKVDELKLNDASVVTYLRFIANFSKIVKPITSLTERNQNQVLRTRYWLLQMRSSKVQKKRQQEMLRDLDQQMEKRANDGKCGDRCVKQGQERVKPQGADLVLERLDYDHSVWSKRNDTGSPKLRWTIYPVLLVDAAESVRDAIGFEYCLALHADIDKVVACSMGRYWESSLTGLELVPEMTDKGHLKILERICPVAYQLRLPKELSGVHDTFHVSNLKRCLADASLHVPLDEIKVDKTLRFIEEPVEIMDREVKSLKHSRISLVKVHWNSKRRPEFTWEREGYMMSKYPQLFVNRADESAS
ncbi:hypothetical protein Tco_0860448 [Tanacetum coccineum]|uniref:Tf2-1-like SH3-like domain-containing protein n=1 Tax=Tanacetum coccineum TaxID=301880 RepID=A0ABQ5BFJ3_9ASTR